MNKVWGTSLFVELAYFPARKRLSDSTDIFRALGSTEFLASLYNCHDILPQNDD